MGALTEKKNLAVSDGGVLKEREKEKERKERDRLGDRETKKEKQRESLEKDLSSPKLLQSTML